MDTGNQESLIFTEKSSSPYLLPAIISEVLVGKQRLLHLADVLSLD